jgi:glycerol-3-phosphate dehydrogenase (NAD(P)+)
MGSALAFPARENGHEVRLVGTHLDSEIIDCCRETGKHPKLPLPFPEGVEFHKVEEVSRAIEGADLVIGGVSSFGVDWFGDVILPLIPEHVPVLSVTKGLMDLEDGTLITYPEVWKRKLEKAGKKLSLNAVGGPCTSYELADHDWTQVCFCGRDMELLRRIRDMFRTDYYTVSVSTDEVGVECAVALKNAYALAVTLAVGLAEKKEGREGAFHYNSQAALFLQSFREMKKLLEHLGGREESLPFGIGDLYVTIFGGRTRKIGTLLGRGDTFPQAMEKLRGVTLESIVITTRASRAVRRQIAAGKLREEDFPLLMHIDEILNQGAIVDIPWEKFTAEYEF